MTGSLSALDRGCHGFRVRVLILRDNHFLFYAPILQGLLKPGGTVVEGTAGNTGIGLAHVCRAKGYKCVIFIPSSQVQHKRINQEIQSSLNLLNDICESGSMHL